MMLSLRCLLVCCSALAVVSSSRVKAPPPGCDSVMVLSSEFSSSSSKGRTDLHSRSLSPWTWRASAMKNRIPTIIWEARCSSTVCSNYGPGGRRLSSVPVYQNILVLHRQDGERCYTAGYQSVAVGCTCI